MAVYELSRMTEPHQASGLGWCADDGRRTVVWLTGEHDLSTHAADSATIAQAVRSDDRDVVVDLSGVTFLDGGTLGVIVRAHVHLRLRSRSLVIRAPSRCARLVIDLCELNELVERPR